MIVYCIETTAARIHDIKNAKRNKQFFDDQLNLIPLPR